MLTNQSPAEGAPAVVPATPAAPPFRLLDDFQRGYLKIGHREPRTLEELAIARASYQHQRRVAEVRAMAKKLALLDEFLPALAARGLTFSYREITTTDGGKTLRIQTPAFQLQDDKLYAALVALGFREVERKSYSEKAAHEYVTLKHGRALLVTIDVTRRPADPGPVETATERRP